MRSNDHAVRIPIALWRAQGYGMLQEAERQFPGERITFSQPLPDLDVLMRFESPDSALMMRMIWSGCDGS